MRLFCVFLPTKHQQIILSDNRISIGNESASFSFDHDNEHPCFLVQLIHWFIPPFMIFVNFHLIQCQIFPVFKGRGCTNQQIAAF